MQTGLLINTEPLDVFEQMAADEAMCDALPSPHMLRFFNWKGEGVTFGYAQRHAMVRGKAAAELAGAPLVRRPTGGGIVFHKSDLTFSVIFRHTGSFEPQSVYKRLHDAVGEAYAAAGTALTLLSERTPSYDTNASVADCFKSPVNMDILYNGTKVLGGALRKFGDHMLYQGSLQFPDARAAAARHSGLIAGALAKALGVEWRQTELPLERMRAVRALAASKYRSREWNERI